MYINNKIRLRPAGKLKHTHSKPAVQNMYNLIYYRYTDLGTLFFLFLCWWWVVTISFFWADACLNLSNELCADEGLALSGAGGLYWQMLNFVCKWADK